MAFHHVFNSRLITQRGHLVPKRSMGRVFEGDRRDLLLLGHLETNRSIIFCPLQAPRRDRHSHRPGTIYGSFCLARLSFHLNLRPSFLFFLSAPPSERLLLAPCVASAGPHSFNYQPFQARLGQEKRCVGSCRCEIKGRVSTNILA